MVEPVEEPQPQNAQQQESGFQKLLAARTEHYAIDAPHEVWLIRELSGLAIGLQCKPCSWEWWRPGWERNEPEVAVADPVVPLPEQPEDRQPSHYLGGGASLSLENACTECGIDNPVWFAPSDLWNLVMGGLGCTDDPGGFLCPVCFIRRAEAEGVVTTGWFLTTEEAADV